MLPLASPLAIHSRRRLPTIAEMQQAALPTGGVQAPTSGQQATWSPFQPSAMGTLQEPPLSRETQLLQTAQEKIKQAQTPVEQASAIEEYHQLVGNLYGGSEFRQRELERYRQQQQQAIEQQEINSLFGQKSPTMSAGNTRRWHPNVPPALRSSLEFQGLMEQYGLQPLINLPTYNEYLGLESWVRGPAGAPRFSNLLEAANVLSAYGLYEPNHLSPLLTAMQRQRIGNQFIG